MIMLDCLPSSLQLGNPLISLFLQFRLDLQQFSTGILPAEELGERVNEMTRIHPTTPIAARKYNLGVILSP